MDLSIFVAKVIAVFYLTVGIGFLNGQLNIKKILKSLQDSPGLTYISGLFMIVIGSLLVQHHNYWTQDWTVLVTIIGWAILIKGILYTAIPDTMITLALRFKKSGKTLGAIIIILGLIFGYFGFVV